LLYSRTEVTGSSVKDGDGGGDEVFGGTFKFRTEGEESLSKGRRASAVSGDEQVEIIDEGSEFAPGWGSRGGTVVTIVEIVG
jgi:hypothetical protein